METEVWNIFKNFIRLIDAEAKDFIDIYGTDSRINLASQLTQAYVTWLAMQKTMNLDESLNKFVNNKDVI
jgi:hypothetical protein|tara:strand:- start:3934 stop:4143 length:210 start_codon:yes stop_codon:yes gene_type:complete